MRTVSPQWASTVAGVHPVVCEVRGEYAGEFTRLVPIIGGDIVYDRSAPGRRRCTLRVPLVGPDGFHWDPGAEPTHPLAPFGQRLNIWLGVRHPDGTEEILSQGYYAVYTVNADELEGVVVVTAMDLYQEWQDTKIINESAPIPANATAKQLLERLSYQALNTPALADRQMTPVTYEDGFPDYTPTIRPEMPDGGDRTQPVARLLADWPAAAGMDDLGRFHVYTPVTAVASTAVATIKGDAVDGTLISRGYEASRRNMYNAVKVISRIPSSGVIHATYKASKTTGPLRTSGPFGWITRWYESPRILVGPVGNAVANRILAEGTLYTRTETVAAVPNPALQLEDTVDVTTARTGTFRGLITAIRLPLSAADGAMQITVTNEQDGT